MGQRLRDVYPHATRWQVLKWKFREFMKKVLRVITIGTIASGVGYGIFFAGAYFHPKTVYAVQEKLVMAEVQSPVMERIAGCESEGNRKSKGIQLAKNGQVVVHANTDGTVDVGKYQINVQRWGSKATEFGYNIFTEQGNHDMAMWIYLNVGTQPWSASQKCWQ